jgi:hypothetical protein
MRGIKQRSEDNCDAQGSPEFWQEDLRIQWSSTAVQTQEIRKTTELKQHDKHKRCERYHREPVLVQLRGQLHEVPQNRRACDQQDT